MYMYSPKNNAFYPVSMKDDYVAAGSWPDDGVEVGEDVFNSFVTAPEGKARVAGDDGMPAWADATTPTDEELKFMSESKKAALKVMADSEISWRQDAVDAEIATDDEVTDLSAWKKYRVLLMRVDTSNPQWPEKPE